MWTPDKNNTFWAAVSRAVRTPNVTEEKGFVNRIVVPFAPTPNPCTVGCIFIRETNDGRTEAEELLAFEAGYRHKIPSRNLSFDITGYYFDYDNLITSINLGDPVFDPSFLPDNVLIQDTLNANVLEGEVYGVELSAEWKPFRNWRLSGSYGYMMADIKNKLSVPINFSEDFAVNGEPEHIFSVRSYLSLPHNFEFDSMLYYVSKSSLPESTLFPQDVKSYTRLDLRLGWKPQKNFELSLVGQNLLDDQHKEHDGFLEFDSETQRSFYAKATFRF